MESNLKWGRTAGFFLLMMILAGIPGTMYRGISSDMLDDPELLMNLIEQAPAMRLALLLSFVAGVFGLLYSVVAYRMLRPHSAFAAITYLSLWILQVAVVTVGDICHYALMETVQLTEEGTMASASFLPMAAVAVKGYIGAHFLGLVLFGGSFVFMHAHFMKYRLLPTWLAIWGMLATGTVFTVTWIRIFDQTTSFHFYNQNGLFMLTFTIYLLIKGFKTVDKEG